MARPTSLPLMILGTLLSVMAGLPGAVAADFSDPNWPCIQRKVTHLAPAQMWAGPPIGESLPDWRKDSVVAHLAHVIAARRTDMEEAEKLIADFAASAGEKRAERLTMLFAGVLDLIDRERVQVIGGIGRYARKQHGLEERLDTTRDQLATLEAKAGRSFDDEDRLEELQDQLAWDTRIFQERQQSLTYVCEAPVILEQRAFALARAIMAHLE